MNMFTRLKVDLAHWIVATRVGKIVAWQGSYQGKDKYPTIVLEAISDYHLWFWQVSYGYAGSLNDLNILNISPFMQDLISGTFSDLEKAARVVPYKIAGETSKKWIILADGIYVEYSRFAKGFKEPVTIDEHHYTKWQEGARKEIERAFGVQAKFNLSLVQSIYSS